MPDLAMTLNNLAVLKNDIGRYGEAEENYLEALQIHYQLAESNPDAYMSDVAMTIWNMACLKSEQKRNKEERETWVEALEIYEWLEQHSERTYTDQITQIKEFIRELDT